MSNPPGLEPLMGLENLSRGPSGYTTNAATRDVGLKSESRSEVRRGQSSAVQDLAESSPGLPGLFVHLSLLSERVKGSP